VPSEGDVTASGEVFLEVFLEVFMSLCPLFRYASSLQWKDALKLTNNRSKLTIRTIALKLTNNAKLTLTF
jgi:hypothetical protein